MNISESLDKWGLSIYEAALPESVRKSFDAFRNRISDERLIVWDIKTVLFVLICLGTFTFFVGNNYSGSSTEKWDQYIVDSTKVNANKPLLGTAKWIRFDEWCLGTPCIRSQSLNGFNLQNPALGFKESPLLMGAPVHEITSYVKPHLWGFLLFDFERGFSFYWYWKFFGIMIGMTLLLKIISRNNFWMSLAGTLWILYSSYVQWWFSTPGTELLVAGCFICISALYVLLSRSTSAIIISIVVLTISSLTFVLTLYPPYQVSLGYLILAVLGGVAWKNYSKEILHDKLILRIAGVVLMFAAIGFIMSHFLTACKDSIAVMAATEYPGNRISTGGVISMNKYWGGFFDFLYSESHLPPIWFNPCEASNFVLLYPIVLIAMIIDKIKGKKIDAFDVVLLVYIVFISLWMLTGYPEFIAKITALNRVRENRALIGIGVGSIFLIIHYLSGDRSRAAAATAAPVVAAETGDAKSKKKKKQAQASRAMSADISGNYLNLGVLAIMVVTFGLMYWFGNSFNAENKNFLSDKQIFGISFAVSVLSALILAHARFLFSTIIVGLVLWSNFMINPIAKGMPAMTDKDLMRNITEIRAKDPDAKWIAYGSNILANYLIATGVNVINGTKFIPDMDMYKVLDPDGSHKKVYNRFAHVHCLPFNPDSKNPDDMKWIIDNEDAFTLCIPPRSKGLRDIGVKYIMSNRTLWKEDLEYWDPLYEDAVNGMYLFKRRESTRKDSEEQLAKLKEVPMATFRVENMRMAANSTHDRFVLTGQAVVAADNAIPGAVYADVNGHLVEGSLGLPDPSATDPRLRNAGFKVEIPYVRLGTGYSEFKLRVFTKDKSGYATSATPLGVTLN